MLEEFDVDLIGFTAEELDDILNIDEKTVIVEDEPPGPKREAISKIGDIWVLGEHRVMCGDSTTLAEVETLTKGKLMDLCVTDPPYNVAYGVYQDKGEAVKLHRRTDGSVLMNDKMGDAEFYNFLLGFYKNMRCHKQGGIFYIGTQTAQVLYLDKH